MEDKNGTEVGRKEAETGTIGGKKKWRRLKREEHLEEKLMIKLNLLHFYIRSIWFF